MSEWLTSIGPAVGDHLWQSTVFAVAAAFLTVLLKTNQARARYWIWLAALIKFLVPFSLLIGLGGLLPRPQYAPVTTPTAYAAMDTMSEPFAAQALPVAPIHIAKSKEHRMPEAVASVWLCGLVVVLAMWWMRWRRVAAVVREATKTDAGREVEILRRLERDAGMRPVQLLLSRSAMEPGMFGVIRPVLLWPEGISARLSDVQLEAILAHELCHVRRRDNLFAMAQMVVQTVFWFYPLLGWMGTRMVEERERACDEEVLGQGRNAETYAESILKICEFCLESPLACVSGITGADLKKRIVQIMSRHFGRELSFSRRLLLVVAGLITVTVPVLSGMIHRSAGVVMASVRPFHFAQGSAVQSGTANLPAFEVATIRPSDPENPKNGGTDSSADHFHSYGWTVKRMIETAYSIKNAQFAGGPKWIESDLYDIDAKVDDATAEGLKKLNYQQRQERFGPMLQALLADRFKLTVRRETKVLPVDVLLVGKGGAKLKPTPTPPVGTNLPLGLISNRMVSGFLQVVGKNVPMSVLASTLAADEGEQDAIVFDETGLKGNYDFTLQWSPEEMNGGANQGPLPGISGAELLSAIQEQLGLRLEVQKRPVVMLVVEHVERPSEN